MGKAEKGSIKWLANKMKAKGLQKLRWYCQMCQKQCRDQNGFKCHMTSESHQRQLLLFADNSKRFLDEFSYDFEKGFLDLLSRRFGTKRVHANVVYQEYIRDREHLHMNATRWSSLTGFVMHLGRAGKVVADETEKGWFITYIDRDPETIARQEAMAKKEKMEKDDQEKVLDFIEKQVERAKQSSKDEQVEFTEFKRENEGVKIKITIGSLEKKKPDIVQPSTSLLRKDVTKKDVKHELKESKGEKRKLSALDEIMKEQEASKEKHCRKDYWLVPGIVVKLVSKSLGEKYYKKKGYVKEVIDKYCALVKMLDAGNTVKVEQSQLETVIPAEGRLVRVVNGAYRDCTATLQKLDEKNFCVTIQLESGPAKGRVVDGVQYEDICKIHND